MTAIAVRVFGAPATVSVALPVMVSRLAVTVVEPAATAVASPDEVMVATFAFVSVQLAVVVTSAVEPSLYVAIAVNCCLAPTATLAVPGVAAIAVRTFVVPVPADADPPQPTPAASSGRQRQRRRKRNEV